jgi:hypothetical protein
MEKERVEEMKEGRRNSAEPERARASVCSDLKRYLSASVSHWLVLAALACIAFPGVALAAQSLPEGRVYEMVSPPYKGGFYANGPAVAPDGEAVGFGSEGVFAGAPSAVPTFNGYLSRRGPDGWVTVSINPPATFSPLLDAFLPDEAPQDYSADLARSVDRVLFAPSTAQFQRPQSGDFYLRESNGAFAAALPQPIERVGGERLEGSPLGLDGASADLSHLLIATEERFLPADTTIGQQHLYEVADAGGASASLRLIGVDNRGGVIDQYCKLVLGSEDTVFHAMSHDGSEVFFSANVNPAAEEHCDATNSPGVTPINPAELYVRIDGAKTLEISKPSAESCPGEEVPCPGAKEHATAVFQGASEDGTKVFFTTTQKEEVPGVTDITNNLYEAEIRGSSVTKMAQVSAGDPGDKAEVQGVTRISDDGSHVYFVATGELTATKNGQEEKAVKGADNLYVYDTVTGETKFVAELCSGDETSGSVTGVTQCPGSRSDEPLLWKPSDTRPVQSTPDGRFLVFETNGQLIRTGPEADTDTAIDVYRYDSQTGDIRRVSVGQEGDHENGNDNGFNATITAPLFSEGLNKEQYELSSRAVTDDGSTIVFTTAEPLSPLAINGRPDIYVWHEGEVGLISNGRSSLPDQRPVITSSGRDIFFVTAESLVPQDTDGLFDVYDARIGGGFPAAAVSAGNCSGSTCQGSPSVPALLGAPASATFSGVGNLAPPVPAPASVKKKPKPRKKPHKKARKKGRKTKRSSKGRKAKRSSSTGKGKR